MWGIATWKPALGWAWMMLESGRARIWRCVGQSAQDSRPAVDVARVKNVETASPTSNK
jgi:hypothetical protein